MALDEPQESDEVFQEKGITFLIGRDLFEQAKPIAVDFISTAAGSGFRLSSALVSAGVCGGSCDNC